MRPRSLSVACDKADRYSKKFEGVTSDQEDDDSEEEIDETEQDAIGNGTSADASWTRADYDKLFEQLRNVLPAKDTKKHSYQLKHIDWKSVAFDAYSPQKVKDVTIELLKNVRNFRTLTEMVGDLPAHLQKMQSSKKPKKPLNAYNFFSKETFPLVKAQYPDLRFGEVSKKISDAFNALSSKKKMKYEKLANEARDIYNKELEEYFKQYPEEKKRKRKRTATTSDNMKIKATANDKSKGKATPFKLFVEAKKKEGLGLANNELRQLWEKLPTDQKVVFIREAYTSANSNLTKDEKHLLERAAGKPELVPRTVSEYYLKMYAEKAPGSSIASWRKEKLLEFKNLPKLRRLELELELRRARAKYVVQYQEYIESLPENERAKDVELLQSYIENTGEKKARPNQPRMLPNKIEIDEHDMTDLPIAESTKREVPKKKSKKKENIVASFAPPSPVAKPLKSILKSPPPMVSIPSKRDASGVLEVTASPQKKKKKKADMSYADSESDSSYLKGNKPAKIEKDSDDELSELREVSRNGEQPKEPKRPPKDIYKYYKKYHYHGKEGKHKESFEKLSDIRKKRIQQEMREAQKNYMFELKKYLIPLPPDEVVKYVKKLKSVMRDVKSADENESEDEDHSQQEPAISDDETLSDDN